MRLCELLAWKVEDYGLKSLRIIGRDFRVNFNSFRDWKKGLALPSPVNRARLCDALDIDPEIMERVCRNSLREGLH